MMITDYTNLSRKFREEENKLLKTTTEPTSGAYELIVRDVDKLDGRLVVVLQSRLASRTRYVTGQTRLLTDDDEAP